MGDKNKLLYFFGRPFSPIYSMLMTMRASLYRRGIFPSTKFDVPVISVGNLTMGGTGKTPMVAHLASILLDKGCKPAIISRGYGGKANDKVNVVSDGREIFLDAEAAGDEPRLLAELLPSVPVLTGVVRTLPCRHAVDQLGCDLLILDDGFQHLAVQRDINLVLFSANSLAGNSRVFPGGDLREPVSSLNRADAFVVTGITEDNEERAEQFIELLTSRFQTIPSFRSSYRLVSLVDCKSQQTINKEDLPDPVYGICGIAQPDNFKRTLDNANLNITGLSTFPDHQNYGAKEVAQLEKLAAESGAKGFVTTEKDMVKLKSFSLSLPLYGLHMETTPEKDFSEFLNTQFDRLEQE